MRYDPRAFESSLSRFLALQARRIERVIDDTATKATTQVWRRNPAKTKDFYFRDYPALSKEVDRMIAEMTDALTGIVTSGVEWSWDLANVKNDDMVKTLCKSIGKNRIPKAALARWSQKNLPALEAFEARRIKGLNLSDKVWSYAKNYKAELELALDLGLAEGKSADKLSRMIRRMLRNPDALYRRVRQKETGILRLSKNAAAYHPGQGVYRSSYKNAMRLAATETNMAYRTSDYERIQQMDFILGIEIHLSNNHTCLGADGKPHPFYDICDELEGRYPRDFKFVGWHPWCRCYQTTILPDKEEFFRYLDAMDENGKSSYVFKDAIPDGKMPRQLQSWVRENRYRALTARSLPYFITENRSLFSGMRVPKEISDALSFHESVNSVLNKARNAGPQVQSIAERIAEANGSTVTPINFKSKDSLIRKVKTESIAPDEVKDSVRTTIVAQPDKIDKIREMLSRESGFIRMKIQEPDKFMGYSGTIVNLTAKNGITAEIQVITPEMIFAKELPASAQSILGKEKWQEIAERVKLPGGMGHRYYEAYRILPKTDPKREELFRLSLEYYSHFR